MSAYPHAVPDRFREIVGTHRDHAALVWSARDVVTFGELDRLSDKAALFLRRQGVHKGDRVCIRLDKCTLAYAIIIACLKTGAPYFVVDPSNPAARVAHILDRCMPSLIFTAREPALDIADRRVVVVDREEQFAALDLAGDGAFEPEADIVGTDPAYIMFTSGSTGFPKGAVMSHANLLNFIRWAGGEFSVTPDDIFTSVNPLYFDNSVFDFYASIMNGASLAPFDAATMRDPYLVLRRIDELRCTIYFSVPSLLIYFQTLKLITPSAFAHVRAVVFGGEGYPKTKLRELFDCLHARAELVNVYGPTECTCICTSYRVTEADFDDLNGYPPLGGPIPNFSFTILNERDEAAAPGEVGELYLGGPCVGLGYFNDPEITRAAFPQNPLNPYHHERLYRTGDLVRLSADDGKVYFVGRKDSQIKHQGYRVELGEIEYALCRVPGVDEAVALHTMLDGVSLIVAVAASRDGLTPDVIRKELLKAVPAYMIPGRVDVLERLPKNDNGKIDRKLLKTRYC
ncbi:MAG TPA: amino acid adenylation domain-containing protein [Pyrinomonadaceae bacterium]|nr:amino acid adenylation domain-containing protein [Pyrinomonadaceae bacterium]